MDLFCRLFDILNFYTIFAQNPLQFCTQQRIVLDCHVPGQHRFPGVQEAEVYLDCAAVKDVAQKIFNLVHFRTVPSRHGQEIPGGPSPAGLAFDTFDTVHAKVFVRVITVNGLHALDQQPGGLVLLDGDAAIGDDDGVFLQGCAALCQDARENDHLHAAGQILDGGKGHQGVGLCRHDFVLDDGTDKGDSLVVKLLGVLPQQLGDGAGSYLRDLGAVGVQRMTGQVEAGHLFSIFSSSPAEYSGRFGIL